MMSRGSVRRVTGGFGAVEIEVVMLAGSELNGREL